jgi:hypothetical protein
MTKVIVVTISPYHLRSPDYLVPKVEYDELMSSRHDELLPPRHSEYARFPGPIPALVMNYDGLREFARKLESGFSPSAYERQPRRTSAIAASPTVPCESTIAYPSRDLLEDDLTSEELRSHVDRIVQRCVDQGSLKNVDTIATVYRELCGSAPLPRAALRRFMRLACDALREAARRLALARLPSDGGADAPRGAGGAAADGHDPLGFHAAAQTPRLLLERLHRLDQLRCEHPMRASMFELQMFGGYTLTDVVRALDVSPRRIELEADAAWQAVMGSSPGEPVADWQ